MAGKFSEADVSKVAEFLNLVAKHARFNLSTTELIQYYGALAHMQKEILPKINANVLEIGPEIIPEPTEGESK